MDDQKLQPEAMTAAEARTVLRLSRGEWNKKRKNGELKLKPVSYSDRLFPKKDVYACIYPVPEQQKDSWQDAITRGLNGENDGALPRNPA